MAGTSGRVSREHDPEPGLMRRSRGERGVKVTKQVRVNKMAEL